MGGHAKSKLQAGTIIFFMEFVAIVVNLVINLYSNSIDIFNWQLETQTNTV